MNDIDAFKGFLNSLSRITPYRFNVWADDLDTVLKNGGPWGTAQENGTAVFGVPLRSEETVIGALTAWGPNGRKNAGDIQTFLSRTAGLIQDRFRWQRENDALAQELTQSFEDLNLYGRIGRQIRALKFSPDRLRQVLTDIFDTMRVDLAFSRLTRNPEFDTDIGRSALFENGDDGNRFIDALIGNIPASEGPYVIVNDSSLDPDYRRLHPETYRFLAVPMRHNGRGFGWLGMLSFNMKEIFRQSELSLLSAMAEQISVVIANSGLYSEMERFVINVVKSLVHAIEAKDYYTRGHSERVNRYCMAMAAHLELEKAEKDALHWASILHDVGKIGIPEIILNKPEGLDEEEYGLVKSHSQKGFDILKPIEQIAGALPGILHHHERYDGKGYPEGLKGDTIPLVARIIAVADTFDAITSNRAYRGGTPAAVAFEKMQTVAGRQLDPGLLDLFQRIYPDIAGHPE